LLEEKGFNQAEKIVRQQARYFPEEARYKVDQANHFYASTTATRAIVFLIWLKGICL
jgi:hypothetical protein